MTKCWCDCLSFRSKVITLKEKRKDKRRRRNMRVNSITNKEQDVICDHC